MNTVGMFDALELGNIFQNTISKSERKQQGIFYTPEENVIKVIRPLFLDNLHMEFSIKQNKLKTLQEFHNKIASIKFLDPSCGCGAFLIVTYWELIKLEIKIIEMYLNEYKLKPGAFKCLVSINQFYGIEYNKKAADTARLAMVNISYVAYEKYRNLFNNDYIKPNEQHNEENTNIVQGNALRLDWNSVIDKTELNYIIGNPPFICDEIATKRQKADLEYVFRDIKRGRELDYSTGFIKKACEYMQPFEKGGTTQIETCFILPFGNFQGWDCVTLWQPLASKGIKINFAYRQFRWYEKDQVATTAVIVSFSYLDKKEKYLFENNYKKVVNEINFYLFEGAPIFLQLRNEPISNIPKLKCSDIRSRHRLKKYTEQEVKKAGKNYIRLIRGIDITHNTFVYCNCDFKPVQDCFIFGKYHARLRDYIIMDYLKEPAVLGNKVYHIKPASFYIFGILSSKLHADFSKMFNSFQGVSFTYSSQVQYNNFIFPNANDKQKKHIEKLSKNIFKIRAEFKDMNLQQLYLPRTMPSKLRQAHEKLDNAVLELYGFNNEMTNIEITNELLKLYEKALEKEQQQILKLAI